MAIRNLYLLLAGLLILGLHTKVHSAINVLPQVNQTQVLGDTVGGLDLNVVPPLVLGCSDSLTEGSPLTNPPPPLSLDSTAQCDESQSGNSVFANAAVTRSYGDLFANISSSVNTNAEIQANNGLSPQSASATALVNSAISWIMGPGEVYAYSIYINTNSTLTPTEACTLPLTPPFACSSETLTWSFNGSQATSGFTVGQTPSLALSHECNSDAITDPAGLTCSSSFEIKLRMLLENDPCTIDGIATRDMMAYANLMIEARDASDDTQLIDTGFSGNNGDYLLCVDRAVTVTFKDPLTNEVVHTSPQISPLATYNFDVSSNDSIDVPLPIWSLLILGLCIGLTVRHVQKNR